MFGTNTTLLRTILSRMPNAFLYLIVASNHLKQKTYCVISLAGGFEAFEVEYPMHCYIGRLLRSI